MKKHILILLMVCMYTGISAQVTPTTTTTTTTTTTATPVDSGTIQNAAPSPAVAPATAPAAAPVPAEQTPPAETSSEVLDEDFKSFYIGGRFLLNVTSLDYEKNNNGTVTTEAVMGYGVGGYLGFNFTEHFALQTEVLYQSLAQNVRFDNMDRKVRLKYLNIPILAVFNTNVMKPVNFNVSVGPQIGIRLKADFDSETSNSSNPDTVQAVLAVKPGDLGIAYGAGLDFRLAENLGMGIGFRGVYGILDISENSNTTTTNQYYILDRSRVKTYAGYVGLKLMF